MTKSPLQSSNHFNTILSNSSEKHNLRNSNVLDSIRNASQDKYCINANIPRIIKGNTSSTYSSYLLQLTKTWDKVIHENMNLIQYRGIEMLERRF